MADFRKLVLALVVLAALVVPASAQTSITCTASVVPTTVRQEGFAEMVGDTELTCTGGPANAVLVNLQIWLTSNVTSKVLGGSTLESLLLTGNVAADGTVGTGNFIPAHSDQMELCTGTNAATCNVYEGLKASDQSIVWNNVTLPALAVGSTSRAIRITNVRANATSVPVTVSGVPGYIYEFISITGSQGVTLSNGAQQFIVAFVQKGLEFTVSSAQTFQQCLTTTKIFNATYKELFVSAFKKHSLSAAEARPTTPAWTQDEPGQNFFTESGLVTADTGTAGVASQGSRFYLRLEKVPGADVSVSVPRVMCYPACQVLVSDPVPTLVVWYVGSDRAAAGNSQPLTSAPSGNQTISFTDGVGTAVWEVVAANGLAPEQFTVPVSVTVNQGVSIAKTPTDYVTVSGDWAPISTSDAASFTSATLPHPRFRLDPTTKNLFNIQACVTNLLFPFVTNQAGFDTGLALVNTSLDNATGSSGSPANQPFNTKTQKGTCTVYYFGAMADTTVSVPAPQTTPEIAAGQMNTFAISNGGVAGATSSAIGFQGYVIARCNFQYAHGYAFVTRIGATDIAHGYLALIIPDKSARTPDPFNCPAGDASCNGNSGEQLAF